MVTSFGAQGGQNAWVERGHHQRSVNPAAQAMQLYRRVGSLVLWQLGMERAGKWPHVTRSASTAKKLA